MSSFLPPSLWGMHPLYNADVRLLCVHVGGLQHDPVWSTSSHFLHGHPLLGVEVAGSVTLSTLRGTEQQIFTLDDGTGGSVQASINSRWNPIPGAAGALPYRVSVGDAVVVSGVLGWAYPLQTSSNTQVRELRVQKLRFVNGGMGMNELCAWWQTTVRLHAQVYSRRLEDLLPSCTPLLPSMRTAAKVAGAAAANLPLLSTATAAAAAAPAVTRPVTLLPPPAKAPPKGPSTTTNNGGKGPMSGPSHAALPPALFSRVVLTLQNSLDLYHPLSRGSASAVARSRFQTQKRARTLTAFRAHLEGGVVGGGSGGGDRSSASAVLSKGGGGKKAGVGGMEEGMEGEEGEDDDDDDDDEEEDGEEEGEEEDRRAELFMDEMEAAPPLMQGVPGAARRASFAPTQPVTSALPPPHSTSLDKGASIGADTVFDEEDALAHAAQQRRMGGGGLVHDDGSLAARSAVAAAMESGKWVVYMSEEDVVGETEGVGGLDSTAAASSSASAPVAAPAPAPAAVEDPPSIPKCFTVVEALRLLSVSTPGLIEEVKAATTTPLTVVVYEALQRLLFDGIVCVIAEGGGGGGGGGSKRGGVAAAPHLALSQLYTVVSHEELIVPHTLAALESGGARWDGMGMEGEGLEGGEGGGDDPRHMPECDLVKALKAHPSLKSIPIMVLRASWKLMEEDGIIVKPKPYTFTIPI